MKHKLLTLALAAAALHATAASTDPFDFDYEITLLTVRSLDADGSVGYPDESALPQHAGSGPGQRPRRAGGGSAEL